MRGIKLQPGSELLGYCDNPNPGDEHLAVVLVKLDKQHGEFVVWGVNKDDGGKYDGSYYPVLSYGTEERAKRSAYAEFTRRVLNWGGDRSYGDDH